MPAAGAAPRPWRLAWQDALYAGSGFYRRPEGPAGHFRTAVHAAPDLLATAMLRLAAAAGCRRIADVGAGRGELLTALHEVAGDPVGNPMALELVGVDVVDRPPGLPDAVAWTDAVPGAMHDTLLVGWELLDVVPCEVAEADGSGDLRVVEVDAGGRERLGGPLGGADLTWCDRWWPGPWRPGDRVEVGAARDAAWTATTAHLRSGLALAVDYDHHRARRPTAGTLTGYRSGRQAEPLPDGTTDLTAHVALDAVAAALVDRGECDGGGAVLVLRQRDALLRLGLHGRRPPVTAAADPVGYVLALSRAGAAAELLDPAGLGSFGWLLLGRGPAAAGVVLSWAGPDGLSRR